MSIKCALNSRHDEESSISEGFVVSPPTQEPGRLRREKEASAPLPENAETHAAKRGYAIARKELSQAVERNQQLHSTLQSATFGVVGTPRREMVRLELA